ncbi:protein MHF1 homolog [Rhodamnia argentea]|uniref:Protein MHF1 homolog n=1 Tax=Rhodamnia argentea TaxID=178133 RepID=A0A8B8QIZ9_9MYRT|nr:protein MHF1 homolog [Rhodamnia argentea]
MEEEELVPDLRNQFKVSAVSLAEAEATRNVMEMSEPVSECIADLALRYAEQLAKDLKLFAQHARRKSVKADDVVISAHRNRGLAASLTSFHDELIAKESERGQRDRRKGKKFPREDEMVDPDYTPESDYTP